jgi:methylase of polypeptide subunit release factors
MKKKYFELSPITIIQDIRQSTIKEKISIRGIDLWVYPGVYPSDRFRSSHYILDAIERIVLGKTVCDMGCGLGVIGQFALHKGSKRVVQVDINPSAIENAKANRELHQFSEEKLVIYESDCFDAVPQETFDLIIFNIPFHSETKSIQHPLERAFFDPGFSSVTKFLEQAIYYSNNETQIMIVFSNKGDTQLLESKFDHSKFAWKIGYQTNTDQMYDSRIYTLTLR